MNIELKILDFIQTLHIPILDKIMVWITSLGDAGMIWILLTAIFLIMPKTRRTGSIMLAALLVQTILCNVVLKNLFARTRPYDVNTTIQLLVPKLQDFSFPSGHTSASFTIVSALYFAKDSLWKPTLVLACLIAVSRLYFICALSYRCAWRNYPGNPVRICRVQDHSLYRKTETEEKPCRRSENQLIFTDGFRVLDSAINWDIWPGYTV